MLPQEVVVIGHKDSGNTEEPSRVRVVTKVQKRTDKGRQKGTMSYDFSFTYPSFVDLNL